MVISDPEAPDQPPPLLAAGEVEHLCRQGFLSLSLPSHLAEQYEELFERASEFFALAPEVKARLYPSASNNTEQGYFHVPGEKEFLTLRHRASRAAFTTVIPAASEDANWEEHKGGGDNDETTQQQQQLEALEETIASVWHDTAHLLERALVDVGAQLSIAPGAWDPLVSESLRIPQTAADCGPTLLRIFHYEPRGGLADPHRDLGLLTLCVCHGRGLQVWERPAAPTADVRGKSQQDGPDSGGIARVKGGWQDASAATLLVGDTLRVLTAGRSRAGAHRVEATEAGRHSIVFALRATDRGVIDLSGFGGEGAIDAKALWDRIRLNRVNVNAQHDVREVQRARVQGRAESQGRCE